MNKFYAIAPLVGLMLFGGVYAKHARTYEARLAETKRLEDLAKEEKAKQQRATQALALEQATAATARRTQERLEKERLEEAQKQARIDAEHHRSAAIEDAKRLRLRVDRLRTELGNIKDTLARGEERIRELRQEEVFLADYVKQAEANRGSFYQLLEKLEAAERGRTAALPPSKPTRSP